MNATTALTNDRRFRRGHPCPICNGHKDLPPGKGARCAGYLSSDGQYAHCTREEYAGQIQPTSATPATYAHRLQGECRCGVTHGPAYGRQHHVAPVVTRYKAINAAGELVGIHGRKDFLGARGLPIREKSMWWEQHAGRSSNLMPLFNLPALLAAVSDARAFLVEGEKTASALARGGVLAVGTMTGADGLPCDDSLRPLLGHPVVSWEDNDDKGRRHMRRIVDRLIALGMPSSALSRVNWPDAPDKGDAANYLARGGTIAGIETLIEPLLAYGDNGDNGFNGFNRNKQDANEEEIGENPLIPLNPWPEPMDKAAFIGPIGSFVLKIASETEAAPEALLMQGLIAVGNAMERSAYCIAEADEHHTNLYGVIVAGTGARKGSSWGQVKRFLKRAVSAWVEGHIVGGLSSGEGLINAVRDDAPAIPDKVVLAFEPEFASVFKVKGRDGNTLSTVLRQGWDGSDLASLTRQSPLKATGTHISLIGHITPEELRHQMSVTDAHNGFANRILWVCARRARFLPEGGDIDDATLNSEVKALQEAITFARKTKRMKRDKDATALWHKVYPRLTTPRAGVLGQVTGRAEAQVLRLSLLYALLDRSPVIATKHLEAALAVWNYCLASAQFIFGAALGDPLAEKLHDELCKRASAGMTRTEMNDYFSGNKSTEEISHALSTLEGQGLALRRTEVGAGGRRIQRWYAPGTTTSSATSA